MKKRRVAVVGNGESLANYFQPDDVESIWAVPRAAIILHEKGWRVDAVFSGDDLRVRRYLLMHGVVKDDNEEIFKLLTTDWPFGRRAVAFVPSIFPRVKCRFYHQINYPLDRVAQRFGTDFINNSWAMGMAYACYAKYEGVDIHGLDHSPDERSPDKVPHAECNSMWIGIAMGLGMEVRINPLAPILGKRKRALMGYSCKGFALDVVKKLPTTDMQKYSARKHRYSLKEPDAEAKRIKAEQKAKIRAQRDERLIKELTNLR